MPAALAWLLLGLVLLLAAVLAIPLEVRFMMRRRRAFRGSVRVSWLFGWVQGGTFGSAADAASGTDATGPDAAPWSAHRARLRRFLVVARTPGLPSRFLRLLKRLLRSVQLDVDGEGRFGLEDPADTGQVYGALAAVTACVPAWGPQTRIQPDFTGPRLEFEVRGRARVIPLRSLLPILGFLLSPVAIRAGWRAARAGRAPSPRKGRT